MTNRSIGGVFGVIGIWTGLLLALAGPGTFAVIGRALWDRAGYLLLACAVVVLLHNFVPKGALAGPVLLSAAGVTVLALGKGWWAPHDLWPGLGFMLALVATSAVLRQAAGSGSHGPIRRTYGMFLNRHVIYDLDAEAPERLDVVAVLCRVVIDLRSAGVPRTGPLEIVASSVAGRIELALPSHWPVVVGRTNASRSIRLDGLLDATEVFDDPRSSEQGERLQEIEAEWQIYSRTGETGTAVVLHVAGVGGSVHLRDRQRTISDPSLGAG